VTFFNDCDLEGVEVSMGRFRVAGVVKILSMSLSAESSLTIAAF
jgi:hypothetical protein